MVALKGLLDSGCTQSIVLKQHANKLTRGERFKYSTYGGQVTSSYSTKLELKLVEFSHSKRVNFTCQVDTTTNNAPYDIILGNNFMSLLNIKLDYGQKIIDWDGRQIAMKSLGTLTDEEVCEALYFAHTQSPILQDLEERQQRILDADYSKVDIDSMVDGLDISNQSKHQLKKTLKKFPILFGGRLGLLDIKPVTIELQKGAKPYKGRYYSVPKALEIPFRKEIDRMCLVAVLKKLSYDDDSPWASPTFAQLKKTGDIRVLTDFRKK